MSGLFADLTFTPETWFVWFFLVAGGILGLILLAGAPSVYRSVRKHVRQAWARHCRKARMLANDAELQRRAEAVEGTYFFPDEKELVSVAFAAVALELAAQESARGIDSEAA